MIQKSTKAARAAVIAVVYAILCCGAVFLYFHNPFEGKVPFVCPVRLVTGFYCPGCGSTRALFSLLHGQFYRAFRSNPAAVILLPFIVYYILTKSIFYIMGIKRDPFSRVPMWIFFTILGLLLVFGVLRNIPLFSFLAPQ